MPKCVRNSSSRSSSGARSLTNARSFTLISAMVVLLLRMAVSPVEPGRDQAAAVIVPEIGSVVLEGSVPHEDHYRRVDLQDVLLGGHVALDLVDELAARGDVRGAALADQEIGQDGIVDLGHVARLA